jgi:peptide/nickel transport system substrate-binding protein
MKFAGQGRPPSRIRRWFSSVPLGIATIVVLAACSSNASAPSPAHTNGSTGGSMTIGSPLTLDSLDPINPAGGKGSVLNLIYEPLIGWDPETLKIEPTGLATKWEFTDPKTFVVHIRKGVKFSDGEAVNAKAVAGSLLRYRDHGTANALTAIESIDVTSEYVDTIHLKTEFAPLTEYLTTDGGNIVAPATVSAFPNSDAGGAAIGAGPYKIQDYHAGVSYTFVPNQNYWNKNRPAKLDKLNIDVIQDPVALTNALKTGRVDGVVRLAASDISQFEGEKQYTISSVPSNTFSMIYFNWDNKSLKDPRVRQAISYAIDRSALNKVATDGKGTVANQFFAPGSSLYLDNAPHFSYNPTKAKKLLAAAGYKNGLTVRCANVLGNAGNWATAGPVLVDQLAKVGITFTYQDISLAESGPQYFQGGGYDCAMGGWPGTFAVRNTTYGISDSRSYYTAANNDIGFDAIDDALAKAYTPDAEKAALLDWYKNLQKNPSVVLVSNFPKIAVLKSKVGGYPNSPLGVEIYRDLYWKK